MDDKSYGDVMVLFGTPRYFMRFIKQKGLNVYSTYKNVPFLMRIIRKFFFILKLPESIWYEKWKYKLGDVKVLILFFTQDDKIVHYINTVNPNIRLILWYWNPVFRVFNPDKVSDSLCEKWSFDENDALKFGMRYNTQFFLDNITLPKNDLVYDVLFVGKDKGRAPMINDLEHTMSEMNIDTYFYIVNDKALAGNHRPFVPYEEYLTLLSKSKSILDIVQPGQNGLTLRPMESLFFRKKLITNDPTIKTREFYKPNNIFIIGEDNVDGLKQFLATPFEDIPADIVKHYDIDSWLKRFFE